MQRNRRIMRCRFILFMLPGVVAGVLLMVGALIASPSEDPIFRALEDEMERSMKELQMGNLERPLLPGILLRGWEALDAVGFARWTRGLQLYPCPPLPGSRSCG